MVDIILILYIYNFKEKEYILIVMVYNYYLLIYKDLYPYVKKYSKTQKNVNIFLNNPYNQLDN